jgi:anthranilate/para-aminobenzoate synthase component I
MPLYSKSNITFSNQGYSPVFKETPFESPHIIYERLKSKNSFLFESVKGSEHIARYSFIGIEPYLVFKIKNRVIETEFKGRKTLSKKNPVERLREIVNTYRQMPVKGLPPFQGGAAGMLSYDFVQYLEKLPKNATDDLDIPDAHFFFIDRLIAFDHVLQKCWIIVCPGVREAFQGNSDKGIMTDKCIIESEDIMLNIYKRMTRIDEVEKNDYKTGKKIDIIHETERNVYIDMVKRAKEYIAAGDIYQANLSLRLSAVIGDTDPWKVYTILRKINPSPFAAFVDFGDYQIVSSSPERLVRVREKNVDTRPIAGTRPRGKDNNEDALMRAELLLNEKERAEHIMLIDLERNDLGKVSDYGSVEVDELMITEDYSHVIHIVSNVKGQLLDGKDCFHAIKAAFPGGTITGVPKVRCMGIIDELELNQRGPYTGSIGYIGFNGNMDLNIIIRSFLIKDGRAYVQAGAGIVADSEPEREYYESLKKAEALIKTLEYI